MASEELARVIRARRDYQAQVAQASDLQERRRVVATVIPTWSGPLPEDVRSGRIEISGLPAETVSTPGVVPGRVLMFLHGGGLMVASPGTALTLVASMSKIAQTTGILPSYRLAPEHVWPAQMEDVITAYTWLVDNRCAPSSILVAGESAGACLVCVLLLTLKERGLPQPAGAALISPMVDLEFKGASWQTNADRDEWVSHDRAIQNVRAFLPDGDPASESPINQDLAGLCPMLVEVGEAECIRDDAIAFAEKAEAAGVDVSLKVRDGMVHMWHHFSFLPEAQETRDRIAAFTKERTVAARSPDFEDES